MRPIEPEIESQTGYVIDRIEFCHYVETQAAELADMAAKAGLGALAGVLSLAVLECREVVAGMVETPKAA